MFKKISTCNVMEVISKNKEALVYEDLENPFEIPEKDGMLYVRVRAIASKVNNNYDGFEREELRKAYKTFIGKPVFIEHQNKNPEHARGLIIDAAFHDDEPHAWIELLLEVDGEAYPLLAEGLRKGRINKVSMGTNVEYSVCSVCGNVARSEKEYCYHIKNKGKIFKNANGEDVLAYEINRGLNFFEISFVVSPAEEWADVLAVYGEQDKNKLKKIASKIRKPGESVKCWNERVAGLKKVAQVIENEEDKMGNLEKEPDVIITVSGGVADVLKKKPGIVVEIRDYDVEEEDIENLPKDEDGNPYVKSIHSKRDKMEKIYRTAEIIPIRKMAQNKALKEVSEIMGKIDKLELERFEEDEEPQFNLMFIINGEEKYSYEFPEEASAYEAFDIGKKAIDILMNDGRLNPENGDGMFLYDILDGDVVDYYPENASLSKIFTQEKMNKIAEDKGKISGDKGVTMEKESAVRIDWQEERKRGRAGGTFYKGYYNVGRRKLYILLEPYEDGYKFTINYNDGAGWQMLKSGRASSVEEAKKKVEKIIDEKFRAGRKPLPREEKVANLRKMALDEDEKEISIPAKPDTIISPEGEELNREDLEPVEKKEEKTLDAFLKRLQDLIDEFKGKEEKAPEEEIEEANEEMEIPEIGEEKEEVASEEKMEKESENISYTQILLAKRLVKEMVKRGAISEEEELEKEAEYSKLSKEELEERLEFISKIPEIKEEKKVVKKSRIPVLKKSLAGDRLPLVEKEEEINPSQLFL